MKQASPIHGWCWLAQTNYDIFMTHHTTENNCGTKTKNYFEWVLWHWSWCTRQLHLEPTRPNDLVDCNKVSTGQLTSWTSLSKNPCTWVFTRTKWTNHPGNRYVGVAVFNAANFITVDLLQIDRHRDNEMHRNVVAHLIMSNLHRF